MRFDFDRTLTQYVKPLLAAYGFKSPSKTWFVRRRSSVLTDVIEVDRLVHPTGNYYVRPRLGIHCPAHHDLEVAACSVYDTDEFERMSRRSRRRYQEVTISAWLLPGLGESPGPYLDVETGETCSIDPHPRLPTVLLADGRTLIEQVTPTWNFHPPHLDEQVAHSLGEALCSVALDWLESFSTVTDLAQRGCDYLLGTRREGRDGPLKTTHVADNGPLNAATHASLCALSGETDQAVHMLERELERSDHEYYASRCRALLEVIRRGERG